MADWPVKLDLSVKVSEETTDKIAGALLDLISPITQPAGLLGQYLPGVWLAPHSPIVRTFFAIDATHGRCS